MTAAPVTPDQTTSGGIKRKRDNGSKKRSNKSANISMIIRFLMATCFLIMADEDKRERNVNGELTEKQSKGKKRQSHVSAMTQTAMTELFFDGVDRSLVSVCLWSYHFVRPNFEYLNPYLFPFIRSNPNITRSQIQHVAYRIWEYLVNANRVGPIKYTGDEAKNMVPLGEVSGWWLETDGDKPNGYQVWCKWDQGDLPSNNSLFTTLANL